MTDIVKFLKERLDDDERYATAVDTSPDTKGVYQRRRDDGLYDRYTPEAAEFYVMRVLTDSSDGYPKNRQDGQATDLSRRFDPARVLRDVAAKRAILKSAELWSNAAFPDYDGGYASAMDDAVMYLATAYADHPEFDPEWSLDA